MSLLFINHSQESFTPTQSGAIATWIWECCRAAQKTGEEPFVISQNSEAAPYDWPHKILLDYPRIPTHKLGQSLFRAERKLSGWVATGGRLYAQRVVRAIREAGWEKRPFVLHNDVEMAVTLRRHFPQARIIHHIHNHLHAKERFRRAYASANIISTGVSDFTSRWNEKYFDLPPYSIQTIYNGVDSERFQPAPVVPAGLPVINFVGRTGIEKAPDLLLQAALQLAKKTKRFQLQILGSNHWGRFELDPYQRELQALVNQLEEQGITVRRPGFITRDKLPAELQRAHIHVVPSRWDEPFGLVTTEAMASGLAVVASRTGGTPEVVGEAGFLFERENVAELATHLEQLVRDENLRREFGQKARVRAEQLGWEQTWLGLSQLAKSL